MITVLLTTEYNVWHFQSEIIILFPWWSDGPVCSSLTQYLWFGCRFCRASITFTVSVRSSTRTSNRRTSSCVWTTLSCAGWRWRPPSGRKPERRRHLDPLVFCRFDSWMMINALVDVLTVFLCVCSQSARLLNSNRSVKRHSQLFYWRMQTNDRHLQYIKNSSLLYSCTLHTSRGVGQGVIGYTDY